MRWSGKRMRERERDRPCAGLDWLVLLLAAQGVCTDEYEVLYTHRHIWSVLHNKWQIRHTIYQ